MYDPVSYTHLDVYKRQVHPEAAQALVKDGAVSATTIEDFATKLKTPRAIWMMVPAAVVDETLKALIPHLEKDDVVIDGGNSYYHDDIRRAVELKPKGIHYIDAGTSGGVWGSERGYCLMIGGDDDVVQRLDPIFSALAPSIDSAPRTPGREKAGGTAEHGYLPVSYTHLDVYKRQVIGPALAWELIQTFLKARFSGAVRHHRRVDKVKALEMHEAAL